MPNIAYALVEYTRNVDNFYHFSMSITAVSFEQKGHSVVHSIFGFMESYTKTITVLPEHLDDLNHVNNVVYLQWVQDIAKEHWVSKTTDEMNATYFWVVVKHELEYKKPAFLDHLFDQHPCELNPP